MTSSHLRSGCTVYCDGTVQGPFSPRPSSLCHRNSLLFVAQREWSSISPSAVLSCVAILYRCRSSFLSSIAVDTRALFAFRRSGLLCPWTSAVACNRSLHIGCYRAFSGETFPSTPRDRIQDEREKEDASVKHLGRRKPNVSVKARARFLARRTTTSE